MYDEKLAAAKKGDISAFQDLFLVFRPQLRSYLYRLLADRSDAEDITQDAFVRGYERIQSFQGDSTLKTWVFRIATNLAYDLLRKQQRWRSDAQDEAKAYAMSSPAVQAHFQQVHRESPQGAYEVAEHIDFCFTCLGKTLPIRQQIAIILKDMYHFSRKEISDILGETEGVVKHLLHNGRRDLQDIFHQRCALINKQGACHQCTELAGIYNPKQAKREALQHLAMVREADDADAQRLYTLRVQLVAGIDPLRSSGADFQDAIMQCTREAIGEVQPALGLDKK